MNRIWTWISTHRHFSIGLGIVVCVALLAIFTIRGCSATSTTTATAPIENLFFWKLLIIGLIVAAVVSRERPYLAITFSGLAVLVFLVLLGKFDGLFVWGILGLPLFAAAGFYGSYKIGGRTGAFLASAAGLLVIFWVYMLYQGQPEHLKIKIGFLDYLFPKDLAKDPDGKIPKVIFTLALLSFAIAWLFGSRFFYAISFIVFLAFLGNATVNQMFDRFPDRLTPAVKTRTTLKNIRDSLLDSVNQAVKPSATEKDSQRQVSAPAPQATARIADLVVLPPGEGQVDIKFTLSASELDRDVLSMYQDPEQGWQQIRLFVNGSQDPSWQWHALTGKGIARYRGIKKFLKAGENVLTIQHRLEKKPVVLKNLFLDKT